MSNRIKLFIFRIFFHDIFLISFAFNSAWPSYTFGNSIIRFIVPLMHAFCITCLSISTELYLPNLKRFNDQQKCKIKYKQREYFFSSAATQKRFCSVYNGFLYYIYVRVATPGRLSHKISMIKLCFFSVVSSHFFHIKNHDIWFSAKFVVAYHATLAKSLLEQQEKKCV